MNEELKIVIKAVADGAKKTVNGVKKELDGLGKGAKDSSGKMSSLFKGIAKGAVAAVVAIGAVLIKLGKSALEANKEYSKLVSAFQASGASAQQAGETYNNLYRFLGDSGKAVEAGAHLAKLTNNQKDLAEWTKITQGIYATFGDSLPIEGLTEAANETARVGKITGTMADALNWAGVSEDEFNAKLAATNSFSEREALIRSTLNGLYMDAANIYEQNNKAMLDYNESQARVNSAMASAGSAITPLLTALNNLGAAFFNALKPAIDAIIPPIVSFVNMITKAVNAVLSFFSALTGKSSSVKSVAQVGASAGSAAKGLSNASGGAGSLGKNLGKAAKEAEKVKKATMGFDELNILPSNSTSSSGSDGGSGGSGGSGGGSPAYTPGVFDNASFETEVEEGEGTANKFLESIKETFAQLAEVFAPSIKAWGGALETIKASWSEAKPHFMNGLEDIKEGFKELGVYVATDFTPTVVNSFSENIAPIVGDVFGFAIEEAGLIFEWFGEKVKLACEGIKLALEGVKTVATDIFTIIGDNWSEYGAPLLDELSLAFANTREMLDEFGAAVAPIFETIAKVAKDVWEGNLKPLFNTVVSALMNIGTNLLKLYNGFIKPVVSWLTANILPIVVDVIEEIIEVAGDLFDSVSQIVEGVVETLDGLIEFIVGVFTLDWKMAWEGIKKAAEGIWKAICGVFSAAWTTIKGVFSTVGVFFGSVWTSIKGVFSSVVSWFRQKFQEAWTAIKNVFKPVGEFFGSIWNTIKTKFTALGTSIGNAVGNAVKKGINGIISTIEKTINGGISLINGAINLINKIPGVSVSKISKLSLPRLARGGVIDSPTIAMIGEQGREAVVPLENNTEWMNKLADVISQRNSTPSKIVLMLDGKELGWANINSINNITSQTGKLQLVF